VSGVDDLFQRDTPVRPAPDRLHRIGWMLAIAAPLNLLGVPCFTGVPGAILTLVAWQLADEEVARVESGALPEERRSRATRLRAVAVAQLGFCVVSLLVQTALFGLGVYDGVFTLLGAPVPAPTP
jgi:hypothetical protein